MLCEGMGGVNDKHNECSMNKDRKMFIFIEPFRVPTVFNQYLPAFRMCSLIILIRSFICI